MQITPFSAQKPELWFVRAVRPDTQVVLTVVVFESQHHDAKTLTQEKENFIGHEDYDYDDLVG